MNSPFTFMHFTEASFILSTVLNKQYFNFCTHLTQVHFQEVGANDYSLDFQQFYKFYNLLIFENQKMVSVLFIYIFMYFNVSLYLCVIWV